MPMISDIFEIIGLMVKTVFLLAGFILSMIYQLLIAFWPLIKLAAPLIVGLFLYGLVKSAYESNDYEDSTRYSSKNIDLPSSINLDTPNDFPFLNTNTRRNNYDEFQICRNLGRPASANRNISKKRKKKEIPDYYD